MWKLFSCIQEVLEDGLFVVGQRVFLDGAGESRSARFHVVLGLELFLLALQQAELDEEEVSDAFDLLKREKSNKIVLKSFQLRNSLDPCSCRTQRPP